MSESTREQRFDPAQYWERRLRERYTLGSVGWTGLGESFNRWSYAVRRRVFERAVRDVVDLRNPGMVRVLDVGTGTGFYLDEWRRLGIRHLTGSDLTATAVERLRARFPNAEIHRLDIGEPPAEAPAETYDAVSVMDVLYHVVDDERYRQATGNLASRLAPGGVLVMTENLVTEQHTGRDQISRTRAAVVAMFEAAGLELVLERPVFFLMNTPVSSRSRLLDRWWRLVVRLVSRSDVAGWALGAALFPLEVLLTRVLRQGPSTKIMAWRRVGAPGEAGRSGAWADHSIGQSPS
jgi:SAM-dependent methyltransferase